MAKLYRRATKQVALNDGVQAALTARTFVIVARAEVELVQHRQDGNAEIDIEHGNVDWYVILSDERGRRPPCRSSTGGLATPIRRPASRGA